jgi:SpoVK/Ycf46/Vps4 family AAA+-type ATPase
LPTGETLAFVMGGADLERRFQVQLLLDPDHCLQREGVLAPVPEHPDQPLMQAPLLIPEEAVTRLTSGRSRRPAFGARFPAQFIDTGRAWDDLVLHPGTRAHIEEIATFIEHGETLMQDWGMAAKLRPGLRCLFHGPPGTGKTMTACLLGRATGRDVYKVDLSLVVSKYIGETEKNLARVFDQAQSKGWILFFDEADALYGKRVESRDAHDRYANQEIAFLLQRIETFDGVTILASNLKDNIDDAFLRRFEAIVYFPMPRAEERLRLWQQGFSPKARLAEQLDLETLARDHVLSGGSVMNVIRFASLRAIKDGGRPIAVADVLQGIRRELAKEGRAA